MEKIAFSLNARFNGPISSSGTQPGTLVTNLVSTAIIIAGIILLFGFALGGFGMVAGAGQNNPEKAARGKQAATYALIGFLVVFTAFWVIQLIEAITGSYFVTSPGI